jgi:hypothetical protein
MLTDCRKKKMEIRSRESRFPVFPKKGSKKEQILEVRDRMKAGCSSWN